MIKTLLFLTALGLVHGNEVDKSLTVPHPDCPATGEHALLPHEYDCTKFYYCEGGEKFVEPRNCPPGTEFSAVLQVCIHPVLADCNLPGSSNAPSETTATATVEVTVSTTSSPTTSETVSSSTTTTTPSTTTTTQAPTTGQSTAASTASSTTLGPSTVASTENPGAGSTVDCETFDNGCPIDFNILLLLPHDTSCRMFYYCIRGEKVLSSCSSGTVFNPAIQSCDHPGSIDRVCEDEESSEENVADVEDKSEEEIELLPNGCPANFEISMLLPNEYYCNTYYQCIFGEKVERRCPSGTHFNYEIQACDHIANVNCQLAGGDASEEEEEEVPEVTTTQRPSVEVGENGCPLDPSVNWLLPHENDCNKFYHCVWGGKVEASCPAGLHFNAKQQICDNPATAGCLICDADCDGTEAAPEVTEAAPEVTEAVPEVTEAIPEVTEAAPEVPEAVPDIESSEEDLPINDDNNDDGSGDDCIEEPEQESDAEKKCKEECNVRPWAHEDCDKYWSCDGEKAVLVICSEGLQFNPSTYTCDFACNSGCIRETVQATAGYDGLKLFLPWNKIDENTKHLLKLVAN